MPDSRLQDISDKLRQHTPLDATEAAHLAATLHFLEMCNSNPLSRNTPEGHITASCLAIHPRDASMVILWHKKIGRWVQPGGHVEDSDESVADASLRELCEETGATTTDISKFLGIVDIDVHPIPAHKDQPEHLHYDVRFGFVMSDNWEPGEDTQWMSAADVIAKLDPPTARLGRKVLQLRS
jgi:8-oxo-dGTP pyrophosphatase MutT (NUDIX family)